MADAATAQARAWNLCWKPGTVVSTPSGLAVTKSAASSTGPDVLILLDSPAWDRAASVRLDTVRPVDTRLIDAAALRGVM